MRRWIKYSLLFLMFLLLAAIPLAQLRTGSIEGYIRDDHGPIAGASIGVHNLSTGVGSHTTSDLAGYYVFEDLRPGRYSLYAEAPRHDSIRIPRIIVDSGQTQHEDLFLAGSHATGY